MVVLDPWSIVVGVGIGLAIAVIHYRCGWKNIWYDGDDNNERTNRTVSRKQ